MQVDLIKVRIQGKDLLEMVIQMELTSVTFLTCLEEEEAHSVVRVDSDSLMSKFSLKQLCLNT